MVWDALIKKLQIVKSPGDPIVPIVDDPFDFPAADPQTTAPADDPEPDDDQLKRNAGDHPVATERNAEFWDGWGDREVKVS